MSTFLFIVIWLMGSMVSYALMCRLMPKYNIITSCWDDQDRIFASIYSLVGSWFTASIIVIAAFVISASRCISLINLLKLLEPKKKE